jgi:hypothetical protein
MYITHTHTHTQKEEEKKKKKSYLINNRQKISTNRFIEDCIQPTYKIDMCLLSCEKHMLF